MLLENPERSELKGIILSWLSLGFFHSMPTSLVAVLVLLRSVVRSRVDLQLENLALRHQIGVLRRSTKKRPVSEW